MDTASGLWETCKKSVEESRDTGKQRHQQYREGARLGLEARRHISPLNGVQGRQTRIGRLATKVRTPIWGLTLKVVEDLLRSSEKANGKFFCER